MPTIRIDSLEDPRIAAYRDLKRSNQTRWAGLFVCEGQLLVERLLASDYEVDSVLLDERYVAVMAPRIPSGVPVYVVADGMVERIVGFNFHRGVIACGRRRASPALVDVLPADAERLMIVVCPQAHDPENLGGVLRNCAAFGVDAVLLGAQGADPFSRRVLRVSMGTVLTLPLVQSVDLATALKRLRNDWGVQMVATVLDERAEPLDNVVRPERMALLFGSERHGLEREWIELCDRRVTLSMHGSTDSLNLSVACGVFLYHFTR
jgi:tRNA G18 (ribose-2'-O)-methylase SpoU